MPRSGWLGIGAVAAALGGEWLGMRAVTASLAAAAALILVTAYGGPGEPRRPSVAAACAVLVGGTLLALRLTMVPSVPAAAISLPDDDGPWTAVVVATGAPRAGHQLATIELVDPGTAHVRLAANLPRYPIVAPGDQILVDGRPEPRPDSPYGAYLERTGVAGTLRSHRLEIEPRPIEPVAVLERLRRTAAEALARVLPEPEAGLAAGILIGLRERVDRELAADFTTAGVSHVVAISGWNIAIVAAAVGALGGSLGRRRRSGLTMLAIVAYVAFSGGSPSVVRAAAMAGVVLVARESGRAGRAAAALGWAVTLLLLADPALISDAGFQLSSLATAGLIAWGTPLAERIGRIGGGRLPNWLAESLGVSLAAQAATLPVVLVTFGRLALVAPLANLCIVPVVPAAMAAGAIAFVAGSLAGIGLPVVLASILALPGWLALTLMVLISRVAADVPYASATLEPPWNAIAGGGTVAAIVALEWRRRRPRKAGSTSPPRVGPRSAPPLAPPTRLALLALTSAAVLTAAVVVERPSGRPTVTILDVGQGDAILVEGSRGGRLLIDGGPDPDRLLVELDARIPPWDRRLDAVILSHPHEDHVAGLALLLERYTVGRTFEPGMLGPGPGYAAWAAELADRPTPSALLAAGDRLTVDDIALDVLWPNRGSVPRQPPDTGTGINNVSIVLLGSVAGHRFLLTGDVEEEVDPELLALVGQVDLLKIAHHGSRTASTDAFLDAISPAIAVASAGAGNPYGHPAPATLARIEARGANVLRTDRDGTVSVRFDPGALTVHSSGGRPVATPRPRTAAAVPPSVTATWFCAVLQEADDTLTAGATVPPASTATFRVAVGLLYHRLDDGSRQDRSRPAVAIARTAGLVHPALARRRRGRRVPGRSDRAAGRTGRPGAGRSGRPPARHRQGAACLRSPPAAPARAGLGTLARAAWTRRAGSRGRDPPGVPTVRRRLVRNVAPHVASRGPNRCLCRQAGAPAGGIARRSIRDVATAPSQAGRRRARRRVGRPSRPRATHASGTARSRGLRGGGRPPRRGPPAALDRGSPADDVANLMPAPPASVVLLWGDDDFAAARAVDRLAEAHGEQAGTPLERWDVRGETGNPGELVGQLVERLSTPALFGGGTLAVVTNMGPLVRRAEHRDALVGAIETLAPGNVLAFVEATPSGTKVPPQKRLAEAITAAGGLVRQFRSPKGGGLTAFIEAEARERGVALGAGAAKELAARIGGFVQEGDAERRHQTRAAATELEKLALYRPGGYVEVADVRALVAEDVPSSVWAMTDAVGERRVARASQLLERLLDSTPEPVILNVLHRRIRELLEVADRVAAGEALPTIGRSMKIGSEFRMRNLASQARAWSVGQLHAALDGLLELDAMVKGAPGSAADPAQRRLAFQLWVAERVSR